MTVFDLFDSIGNVDDKLIEKAKQAPNLNKKVFVAICSLAACAVIAGTGIFIATAPKNSPEIQVSAGQGDTEKGNDISSDIYTGGAVSEEPHTEESIELAPEIIDSDIYYVRDGKLESQLITHRATSEETFYLWKNQNHIGDEVKFISVKIESNASVTESEFDGQGVTAYHTGNHFCYNLTITRNIEDYYSRTDKNLLLESLQKTMMATVDMKMDEYHLILAEG